MDNNNNECTSACFIEMWRWFNEKFTSWKKKHNSQNDEWEPWTRMLKESPVYCRYEDEDGNVKGWFRITNFEDHGPNVTLVIKDTNGVINV